MIEYVKMMNYRYISEKTVKIRVQLVELCGIWQYSYAHYANFQKWNLILTPTPLTQVSLLEWLMKSCFKLTPLPPLIPISLNFIKFAGFFGSRPLDFIFDKLFGKHL